MNPLGLEPRTHGLKGRCSTIELGVHATIDNSNTVVAGKQKSLALANIEVGIKQLGSRRVPQHAQGTIRPE